VMMPSIAGRPAKDRDSKRLTVDACFDPAERSKRKKPKLSLVRTD